MGWYQLDSDDKVVEGLAPNRLTAAVVAVAGLAVAGLAAEGPNVEDQEPRSQNETKTHAFPTQPPPGDGKRIERR